MNWNEAIKQASEGRRVLIVGDGLLTVSANVNDGALFVRGLALSGLKSVAVDTVWFIGEVPEDIQHLAMERTQGHLKPRACFERLEESVRRYREVRRGGDESQLKPRAYFSPDLEGCNSRLGRNL